MVGHRLIFMDFAVAAIFNKKGKLLLQKRSDKKTWGLPGGAIELGETFENAVIREVWEETGLKVKPRFLIGIYTGPDYNAHYPNGDDVQPVSALFGVEVIGGELAKIYDEETLELRYFDKNNLPEIANNDFVDMIHDAFSNKGGIWH